MEHRWNPRRQIEGELMVRYPDGGVRQAQVINCSVDGLLVEWGPAPPAKGALVALAEATACRFHGDRFPLKALIVHSGEGRAGLMFMAGRHHRELARELLASLEAVALFLPAPAAAEGAQISLVA